MSNHFFPATPKNPRLAFSFTLLDVMEAYMLECQVALKDFVAALNFLSVSLMFKVRTKFNLIHDSIIVCKI